MKTFRLAEFVRCAAALLLVTTVGCGGDDSPGSSETGGPGPSCGNGQIDGAEVCDGNALRGNDCEELGYLGGQLACAADCMSFDVSGCTDASCGDNVIDPAELCDGTALGGQTCVSQGFAGGDLACTADCEDYDISGCEDDCDEEAALACDENADAAIQACTQECGGGGGCDAVTCEAECTENQQESLEACYQAAGCIFKALDADCLGGCADALVECTDENSCEQCTADYDACIVAC